MSQQLLPRPDWVKPRDEEPNTADGMAEYMNGLKSAHTRWEELVAEKVRVLAHWKREVMDKRPRILKQVKTATA